MSFSCQGRRNEKNSGGGGERLDGTLLNYVPFVPTCLTSMRAYISTCLTCLRALRACVPTCLRVLNYYVPTCLHALIFHVPTCLILLCAYVTTRPHFARAYVTTCLCGYIYFSCLRAFVPRIISCLRALIFHVLTCQQPFTKYIETHFYTFHLTFYSIQNPKTNYCF